MDITNFIKTGSKYFLKLDLCDSYHQIRLHKDSRKFTQFLTEFGKFQYKVLPEGISASGDLFNARMDIAFETMSPENFIRLIDDILIQGQTEEEVIKIIDQVLTLCKKYGHVVSLIKVGFGQKLVFCGYLIEYDPKYDKVTIQPDPQQIDVLKQFDIPTKQKEVESF